MKNTKTNNQNQISKHIPVLLEQVLFYLQPKEGDCYLDLTAGYGGHASKVLERTLQPSNSTLVDRDQKAIAYLRKKFKGSGIQLVHQDFLGASRDLSKSGKQFDLILADLGVSSPHLNNASRGFSLKAEGPLDMRMDQTQSVTAETIVNNSSEAELCDLIRKYGEEPRAGKIARMIVENRPITKTTELANIVARAQSFSWKVSREPHAWTGQDKIHPATRTFQALRIAVNDELEQIKQAANIWIELLAPGGRIAVISFHSLEDRIIKQAFSDLSGNRYDAVLKLLTKHPVRASAEEVAFNPRARSAKLRAAAKQTNIFKHMHV